MTRIPVSDPTRADYYRWQFSLCWRSVVAGTLTAIGLQILLTILGLGGGLATFSPLTDEKPLEHFDRGAAIIWSVCALISLWFGALLAGRFSHSWHSGFVHGILVWCLTLIITLLLLSKGTGMVLGGGLKVLGASMGISELAVSAPVTEAAKERLKPLDDELGSFTEEAVQSMPTNSPPSSLIRTRREVGMALAKLFAQDNDGDSRSSRAQVIQALTTTAQMREPDATALVDGWITSYKSLKSDLDAVRTRAAQKTKAMAEQAARQLSRAATEAFFVLLAGLIVSAAAGAVGARCALKRCGTPVL